MLKLNMLQKQEKKVWLICFPCTENSISLILRKSRALKKTRVTRPFQESTALRNKILPISKCQNLWCFVGFCHTQQAQNNSFWKWNKNLSRRSLQLRLVLPIVVFVPRAKSKNLCPFGESRSDCWHTGAGKNGKPLNKTGFLSSLFSFSSWRVGNCSQCG